MPRRSSALFSFVIISHLASTALAFFPANNGGLSSAAASSSSSTSSIKPPTALLATAPSSSGRERSFAETQLASAGTVEPDPVNHDRPDWLPKLPNGCESDYECDGMESCCDFLLFKACCTDGHSQSDWAPVPVPIPVRPGDGYYGGGGGYYR